MKKSITRIASIAALTTVALVAQGPRPENGNHGGGGTGSANPPDVATIVARQVNVLTRLLTLTTGQATQATTIFTTALNAITPIDTQITTARTALDAAIKTNTTATINTQATAIGTLQGQIVAHTGQGRRRVLSAADHRPADQTQQPGRRFLRGLGRRSHSRRRPLNRLNKPDAHFRIIRVRR